MAKKERVMLSENEKSLLEISVSELIPRLIEKKDLLHLREHAFGVYSTKNKEELQVHVMVTRCKSDFLQPFQVEEMREFKPTK